MSIYKPDSQSIFGLSMNSLKVHPRRKPHKAGTHSGPLHRVDGSPYAVLVRWVIKVRDQPAFSHCQFAAAAWMNTMAQESVDDARYEPVSTCFASHKEI